MFLDVTAIDCGGIEILKVIKFIWSLLDIVFIIVPIGLLLFITLDFGKSVIASKEDEMRKNLSIVIKRLILCVVLFLVPIIVNAVINILAVAGVDVIANFDECIDIAKESEFPDEETKDKVGPIKGINENNE